MVRWRKSWSCRVRQSMDELRRRRTRRASYCCWSGRMRQHPHALYAPRDHLPGARPTCVHPPCGLRPLGLPRHSFRSLLFRSGGATIVSKTKTPSITCLGEDSKISGSSTVIEATDSGSGEEECTQLPALRQWPFHLPAKTKRIKLPCYLRHMGFFWKKEISRCGWYQRRGYTFVFVAACIGWKNSCLFLGPSSGQGSTTFFLVLVGETSFSFPLDFAGYIHIFNRLFVLL